MTQRMLDLAPWYQRARTFLGTKEVSGKDSNPVIVTFWRDARMAGIGDDSTPWCAGFVNAMLERSGVPGTRGAAARSFVPWGRVLVEPALGCIVILKRPPSPWQGHVGFYAGETDTHILILGGNQGDAVSLALFAKSRLIGYRWPSRMPAITGKIEVGQDGIALDPSDR